MTFNRDYFVKFKPISGKVYLAGRNNVIESKGIGSIKVKIPDDKGATNYVIMSCTFPIIICYGSRTQDLFH